MDNLVTSNNCKENQAWYYSCFKSREMDDLVILEKLSTIIIITYNNYISKNIYKYIDKTKTKGKNILQKKKY